MLKRNGIFTQLAAILLILIMLTGCSEKAMSPDDKGTEGGEIVVAARAGSMADALETLATEYEENTGVKVKITALPYDSLKEKIVLDVRNNSGAYDLVMMDDPWMPELGESGLLTPLDDYFKDGVDEDFIKKSVDLCRVPYESGSLYALPLVGNVQMFFYRKDLFEKYDLEEPTTWEQVLEASQVITEKEPETFGYVLRGQRGNPVVSNYIPLFWAYGGKVLDENMKPQVNSEAGIKSMQMYLKLKETGPIGVETFDSDQIATALTQGTAAMTIAWPSWVSKVDNEESSKVVGKIKFAAVPGEVNDSAAMIGNWLLGVPKTSKNTDLAVEFLKWVTDKDAEKKMALAGGGVPTRISLYQDTDLIEEYRHFPAQLDALEHSVARPRTPLWSKIEDTWGLYLSQIVSGEMEIKEGLDKANKEIEKIMQ